MCQKCLHAVSRRAHARWFGRRTIRARVGALQAGARAVLEFKPVPPEAGSRLLNTQKAATTDQAFRTSNFHPLAYDALEQGWDPRARRWTGRQGLVGLPKEPTSLWCSTWGAVASERGLDTDFRHSLQKPGVPPHNTSMHTRGWR